MPADCTIQAHGRLLTRISIPQDPNKATKQQPVANEDFPMGRAHREANKENAVISNMLSDNRDMEDDRKLGKMTNKMDRDPEPRLEK
jgi:hypothetical protein